MESRKKYMCIYVLKSMLRSTVGADSLPELFELLEMKQLVSGSAEGLSDAEILDKIYADSQETTGHLTVYKLNENYDPDGDEEFDDEYLICKHGIV